MSLQQFYNNIDHIPINHKAWFESFTGTIVKDGIVLCKKNPEKWFNDHGIKYQLETFNDLSSHLEGYTFTEKMKLLILGYWSDAPTCKLCGSRVKLRDQLPFTPRDYCGKGCAGKSPDSRKKAIQTSLERFGVDNPSKSDNVKNKICQSMQTRYGFINAGMVPEFQEKAKKTLKNNHASHHPYAIRGVGHLKHISDETFKKIDDREWLYDQYVVQGKTGVMIADELGDITDTAVLNRCRGYGFEIHRHTKMSLIESKVNDFLCEIHATFVRNTRSVLPSKHELDFFLPDQNIAIEVNGAYWHSQYDRLYHQSKKVECMDAGIDLIHVGEDDINDPRRWAIIKSIISNRLGKSSSRYGARELVLKEVNSKIARGFYNDNHLQGYIHAETHLALVKQGDVIAMISMGRVRYKSNHAYELYRSCVKIGCSVAGGISRLINHFRRHHSGSIISYVDLDYFSGSSFKGWTFLSITQPGYKWTNGKTTFSRYQTQKSQLPTLLQDKFRADLTEEQNMMNSGFFKVFNSGNAVFEIA